MDQTYAPIGHLRTCFTEKFGAPRQAQMIPAARGLLKLRPDPGFAQALQGLETFSHVWVIFVFDRHAGQAWRPLVKSPRVNVPRVGVFASRSPHRPNPIGMSAVALDKIDLNAPGGIEIHLSGIDILDNTPVLDIKPYLPYADIVAEANAGWAHESIRQFPVTFSSEAEQKIAATATGPESLRLRALIEQMLSWDPRPASQRETMPLGSPETEGRVFRFRVAGHDVEWRAQGEGIHVLTLLGLPNPENNSSG
jgi:tRNA-Thr(GGU) m(6)t(6)A37 methyltransferase TsaA